MRMPEVILPEEKINQRRWCSEKETKHNFEHKKKNIWTKTTFPKSF